MEITIVHIFLGFCVIAIFVLILGYKKIWYIAQPTDITVKSRFGRMLPVNDQTGGAQINIPILSQVVASVSVQKRQDIGRVPTETENGMTIIANFALTHELEKGPDGTFAEGALKWALIDEDTQNKIIATAAMTAVGAAVRKVPLERLSPGKIGVDEVNIALSRIGRKATELYLSNPDYPEELKRKLDDLAAAQTEAQAIKAYSEAMSGSTPGDVVRLMGALNLGKVGRKATIVYLGDNPSQLTQPLLISSLTKKGGNDET